VLGARAAAAADAGGATAARWLAERPGVEGFAAGVCHAAREWQRCHGGGEDGGGSAAKEEWEGEDSEGGGGGGQDDEGGDFQAGRDLKEEETEGEPSAAGRRRGDAAGGDAAGADLDHQLPSMVLPDAAAGPLRSLVSALTAAYLALPGGKALGLRHPARALVDRPRAGANAGLASEDDAQADGGAGGGADDDAEDEDGEEEEEEEEEEEPPYGDVEYWRQRYVRTAALSDEQRRGRGAKQTDEWLLGYRDLRALIQRALVPGGAGAASRVLDLGCGMSRLLADLRWHRAGRSLRAPLL
jgi:hypothetical protein